MPRRDRRLQGPETPAPRDIEEINRVFSDAFTDRYHRDGMSGVRVPYLNPEIWRYAIDDAGDGAFIWRDPEGRIAAFNMVHQSGTEGWMGPLAVRPDWQRDGVGTLIVRTGIEQLQARGAATIGLETMPRTVDNIGFYSRIGFSPGHLTVTVCHDHIARRIVEGASRLSTDPRGMSAVIDECRVLSSRVTPGVDFSRELAITIRLGVGDTTLVRESGNLVGLALWHSVPLASGRESDEIRVLKLVALDLRTFHRVIEAVEQECHAERVGRLSIRCQTAFPDAFDALMALGYRVHWTDLRMALRGHRERVPLSGVLFSNWEI